MSKKSKLEYEFFEHTADIGIIVKGKSIEEVIQNLVLVFTDLTTDIDTVSKRKTYELDIKGETLEEMVIRLLEEVIFIFDTKGFLPSSCNVKINKEGIKCLLRGERFNRKKHNPKFIIKAITYHQFELKNINGGWKVKVVFDV